MSHQFVAVLDAVQDVSRGNVKIPQKEYLEAGEFPVVDQGQSLVGGYTDDESRLCKAEPPVIVFGDHTRAVKYVDFHFCMGADGTKVLAPRDGNDPRYLYHAISALDLEGAGYSRHFKFLKEKRIPLPPLAEQKRIAKVLDAADALRVKRRESLAKLDALLQSTFLEMFGDPVENPKGWQQVSISSTESQVQIGPFGSLLHKDDYVTNGTPLVNPKHIVDGRIAVSDKETVSPAKAQELGGYQLRSGDVVLGRRGEMGRAAVVRESDGAVLCGTGSMFVRPNDRKLHPEYLQNLLSCAPMREKLEQIASGVTMLNLNATKIKELVIPVPPIADQEKYPGAQASISRQRDRYEAQAADLGNLFAALQQRAFTGQL